MRRQAYSRTPITMRSAESTSPAATAAACASRMSSKLAVELRHPRGPRAGPPSPRAARACQLGVHRDVRVADGVGARRGRELLATELAQRLEQAVTGRPARDQHRLVDEHAEQAGDVALVDARRPARTTRSARSSTNGPANTESRSNSSCSTGVSSSYDHSTRSRSVRCRGSVARRDPASTRKRSGSRSASSAGAHRPHARRPRARTRAARRRAGCRSRRRRRGCRRRA